MSEKPKPCPWCGGEAKVCNEIWDDANYDKWSVKCPKCEEAKLYHSREQAIAFWNHRPWEKEIERLQKLLAEKELHE